MLWLSASVEVRGQTQPGSFESVLFISDAVFCSEIGRRVHDMPSSDAASVITAAAVTSAASSDGCEHMYMRQGE